MKANRSISEVIARLESQAKFHRERAAHHAQHEELHHRQRSEHTAELEQITQRLEAFRASAAAALDLADRVTVRPEPGDDEGQDLGPASRPRLGRMVKLVIDSLGDADRFGPNLIVQEVNRRFGKGLRKQVDARQISVVLRRLQRLGQIHLVRAGRPYREAFYSRVAPDALASPPSAGS